VRRDATTAFARALVDEWVRAGLERAVVAPGSRSAPLALALAQDDRVRVHVVLDERSAGFFALGLGRATGVPAVLLCTSGTAAAGFHPAVLEAAHGRVPILVCTADRPPELRGVGAAQTIDQARLSGGAPRLVLDVPPPDDRSGVGAEWRALAARAWAAAIATPAGPVHLNLAFREPLVPTGAPLVAAEGRGDGAPWTATHHAARVPSAATAAELADWVRTTPRGLVVAGWGSAASPGAARRFAAAAGWPVLADPLSGLRAGPGAISTHDALLRSAELAHRLRPDAVLRLGAMPTSKATAALLAPPVAVTRVDPGGEWLDPDRADARLIVADPDPVLDAVAELVGPDARCDDGWVAAWSEADRAARRALDAHLDGDDEPFEGRVARDVLAAVPAGTDLLVGSSMPVRDLDSFGAPRDAVRVLANRGVNGIDGLVSTAIGVAAGGRDRTTVALLGDLAFLHDTNGLLGVAGRGVDVVFVVVDNDGGGIFSFLPQAELPEHFEELFGTPHGVDVGRLAAVHGIPVTQVARAAELAPALRAAIAAGGVRLVQVRTDRARNVARHRSAFAAAAVAVLPR
jgi:2-succinyl-5-enolpyruvyl-6-hydroxy-3-cyclohexene-1-carboxylate synthase